MLVLKRIQRKSTLNKHERIASKVELVHTQQRLTSVNQVTTSRQPLKRFRRWHLLGEEKPQPFISLDIDKQVDGKVVTSNHISGAPNGRLPLSSNYQAPGLLPLPSYLSAAQPNTHSASSGLLLDGGVYQGQGPSSLPPSSSSPAATTTAQANDWNSNQKVS